METFEISAHKYYVLLCLFLLRFYVVTNFPLIHTLLAKKNIIKKSKKTVQFFYFYRIEISVQKKTKQKTTQK